MKYIRLVLLIVVCVSSGYFIGGEVANAENAGYHLEVVGMSYGYEEVAQLWHRIRVNNKGHVICAKETE